VHTYPPTVPLPLHSEQVDIFARDIEKWRVDRLMGWPRTFKFKDREVVNVILHASDQVQRFIAYLYAMNQSAGSIGVRHVTF